MEHQLKKGKNLKAILFCICLLLFIDAIGTGLIFPIMPTLFLDAKLGLILDGGASYRSMFYGISFAMFPLAALFGMPILGSMSDKLGRKNTLIGGVGLVIISYSIITVSVMYHLVWLFLFARLLSGFSSGTYSIANAAIIDISRSDTEKIRNLKYASLASISGFVLGPGFSVFMQFVNEGHSLRLPFEITIGLAVINFILLVWLFPKYRIKSADSQIDLAVAKSKGIFSELLENVTFVFQLGGLRRIMFGYFCFQFGFGLFLQSLSLFLSARQHYSANLIGLFYVVMCSGMTFSMFFLHRKIKRHWSGALQIKHALKAMYLILFLLPLCILGLEFIGHGGVVITWIFCMAFYILVPFINLNLMNMVSNMVEAHSQGKLMGGAGALSSIAMVLSALLVGLLATLHESLLIIIAGVFIYISRQLISKKSG